MAKSTYHIAFHERSSGYAAEVHVEGEDSEETLQQAKDLFVKATRFANEQAMRRKKA